MNMQDYKNKCKKLAELYTEASETGQPFQNNITMDGGWVDTTHSPHMVQNLNMWRVKPQETWQGKLFEGCPVMWDGLLRQYNNIYNFKDTNRHHYRLPTIKESPRNVWLCPHDKKPEGFDDVRIIFRNKLNNTWDHYSCEDRYDSNEITAFMILEDLK